MLRGGLFVDAVDRISLLGEGRTGVNFVGTEWVRKRWLQERMEVGKMRAGTAGQVQHFVFV